MRKLIPLLLVILTEHLAYSQELTQGTFSVKNEWAYSEIGTDTLTSLISFKTNSHAPSCDRLSLIQAARVRTSDGKYYEWKELEGQSNRNLILSKSGFFIDHDASKCKQGESCSPFYRDSWKNSEVAADDSSLYDAPYGWDQFESIELETCSVCENQSSLKVLGCMTWGGKWPLVEERTILPNTYSETPSPDFEEALRKFLAFYNSGQTN